MSVDAKADKKAQKAAKKADDEAKKAAKKAAKEAPADDRMTLTEHLAELRARIIKSLLALVIGAALVFAFYNRVLNFLSQPYFDFCESLKGKSTCTGFLALDPLEPFLTRTRISMWGGIIIGLPVILWQIWRFVVPGLHAKEKKYAAPFVVSSVLLFLFGSLIAYWILSKSLEFLINWGGADFQVSFTIEKYIRLLTLMMLAFGTGFLFPVLLVFLQLVRVLTPRKLLGWWRHATVLIILAAAVITPSGDVFSLFGLAVPMWIFYWAAILIGWLATRKKDAPAEA